MLEIKGTTPASESATPAVDLVDELQARYAAQIEAWADSPVPFTLSWDDEPVPFVLTEAGERA